MAQSMSVPRRALVVVWLLASTVSCSNGGTSGGGLAPAEAPVAQTFEVSPGEILSLSDLDLPARPDQVQAWFVDRSQVEIPGQIIDLDRDRLEIVVPTGVRTGTLVVQTLEQNVPVDVFTADVIAQPEIIGYGIGSDRVLASVRRSVAADYLPRRTDLIGYNLDGVAEILVVDGFGVERTFPALHTLAPSAPLQLSEGLDFVGFELPYEVDGPTDSFVIEVTAVGTVDTTGTRLESNSIEIPVRRLLDSGEQSRVPPTITGVLLPTGVRSHHIPITYSLAADPVDRGCDVAVEYRVAGTLSFMPCTPRDSEPPRLMLPGPPGQGAGFGSVTATERSPKFWWDSAADLGAGSAVVSIRVRPINPMPAEEFPMNTWITGSLVIDNGAGQRHFKETFSNTSMRDEAETRAVWEGDGFITTPQLTAVSSFGTGSEDVVLLAGQRYVIDTDLVTMATEGSAVPQLIDNPGQGMAEFHVRSLTVEAGAHVEVRGTAPLVIRAAGVGELNVNVIDIASDLDLMGRVATGAPGGAGPGGGAGGSAGVIEVDPDSGELQLSQPAGAGQWAPGTGAENAVLFEGVPIGGIAGWGGGGGGREAGDGPQLPTTLGASVATFAPSGRGGPARGGARATMIRGGAGGGGSGSGGIGIATDGSYEVAPGARGGGGGGGIELYAAGSIRVSSAIRVNGGDGELIFQAWPWRRGGGGAGGTIYFRSTGVFKLTDTGVLDAREGHGGGYGLFLQAGNGAQGRIWIDSDEPSQIDGAIQPPQISLATHPLPRGQATIALSRPYSLLANGGVRGGDMRRAVATTKYGDPIRDPGRVVLLYEGATERLSRPGLPGPFGPAVENPRDLGDVDFLRLRWILHDNLDRIPPKVLEFEFWAP